MSRERKTREELLQEIEGLQSQLADLGEGHSASLPPRVFERERHLVFDSLSENIMYLDLDMRLLWANHVAAEAAGMALDELLGGHCYEIWHGRDAPCTGCPVLAALRTGEPSSGESGTPDGRQWLLRANPVRDEEGRVVGAVEIATDITHRKRMVESLQSAKEELEARVSERTADLSEANERLKLELAERARAEKNLRLNEARLEALIKLNDMTGESLHTIADFALEEGVRLTESKLGYLAFVDESESVLNMYSWSRAARATCQIDNPPTEYSLSAMGLWGEAIRQRRTIITDDYSAPDPYKRGVPEGHVALTRHMNVPVFDGDRIVMVAGVANKGEPYNESDVRQLVLIMTGMSHILNRKQLEERLLRSQRLETAGRIAGQVAHDFNNLLGPLVAYPELMKLRLPPDDPGVAYCDSMLEAAQVMADLNTEMLALSRRGLLEHHHVDVNQLVQQAVLQLGELPPLLRIDLALAPALLPVNGSPSQISRMFSNLLRNAQEALRDIGSIRVETANVYVDQPFGRYSRIEVGEYVKISVADTGCGIADDIRDRIFDAFFTTKRSIAGHGCGLGLSIVQAVVEDHRGYIDLETEVGKGSTFIIYLPIQRESGKPAQIEGVRGGSETILVVDDDELQRGVSSDLLRMLGYRVETAANGEEAVAHIRENPVDLLILDMILDGGIDGTETYRRVLEVSPGQRAIVVSGYAESDRVRIARDLGAGSFLRKPLTVTELSRAVRAELDR